MMNEMAGFSLPRYREIPGVGLYLEQTTRFVNDALAPLGEGELTGSMVSNYVKQKLLPSPVKKLYYREHIAVLTFIAVMKNAALMEDIRLLLAERGLRSAREYDEFCAEFEELLQTVFTLGTPRRSPSLQYTALVAAADRIYLDSRLRQTRLQQSEAEK